MASDVDIVLEVATKGVEEVYKLSNAMQQLNKVVAGVANPMKALDARSRALSAAVGSADSSLKAHAKTVDQLARNNAVLTNELGRVRKEIAGMGTEFRFATGASASFRRAAISDLKAYEGALKGIRLRALTEDLKGVAQEQKRLGKDAQFVGRSLIIGLTTPIMGFARYGLQALVGIDKEFVRLNKVLENVAPNLDQAAKKMGITLAGATKEQSKQLQGMVDRYDRLDKSLTKVSNKFGLAKSLTVGLAGDFAELGIQSEESIAKITELTAATEKLGDMDIAAAKDLVQSLYFQAQRSMQMSGQSRTMTFQEREIAAIGAATAQLNLFNSVENVTALTLRDLGDAFPEVAAAGSSFGLSMTELAAMLAPMKAAGFEVGASANSIKVSLQRLVAPTKQNSDLFKQLSKEYDVNFTAIKGTGLDAIQSLIDGFNELKGSAAGQEGAMEFFAKVFGVRQGPRMEVAIAQLADFDEILKSSTYSMDSAEKQLQGFANQAVTTANVTKNVNLPVIKSYKDIGIIARIATTQMKEGETRMIDGFGRVTMEQVKAARQVRQAVTDEIVKAQRERGEDIIGQVGSEAGRAMFIELAGAANAAEIAQRELDFALSSLDTQLSILKNNFKSFAADLLQNIRPAIEKITDVSNKLITAWKELTPQTRKLISTVVIGFAAITASIGPLIFVFGQFRLAMGSIGGVLFKFLPGLKTLSVEALAGRDAMLRLTKPLTVVGDTVVNTNTKFATFLATLASGEGPVGRLANKIGLMTGALQKQNTASMTLTRSVNAQKAAKIALAEVEGTAGIAAVASTPAATGFKALSTAPLGPSAMPAMPVMRKLTAAELALPDADRIAHETDVARKAAEAYTNKYRETLKKLLGGKPMPLAGGVGPTGMYRYPAGSTAADGTKVGGRLLNFGKIKAEAEAAAAAVSARVESLENARGLRELKKYNAERIAELRANMTAENKIALERYQQLVFRRDRAVQAILAEQNAVREAGNAARRAAQQAKGIDTKLARTVTGVDPTTGADIISLTKERFFKGRKIDDDQFEKIMGGGIKGRLETSKLNLGIFKSKSGEMLEKGSGKFLGGKQTLSAVKGIGTFGKDLFTQPSKALGDFVGLFKNGFSSITGAFGKIGPMFAKIGGYIKNPISLFMKFKSIIIGLGPAIMTAVSSFGAITGIGLIIGAIVGIVIVLVKNWDAFVAAIQPGIEALKDTFDILKDAVMGLVQPFIDFFNSIGGEGEGTNAVVAAIATTFNILADIIKVLAIALKFVFVEIFGRVIKIALGSLLALLKGIGNFVMGLWKVIKGIFTFNWSSILDGFKKIAKGIAQTAIGLMGPFADFFVFVLKGVKMIFDQLAKLPGWLGGGVFKKASQGIGAAISFVEDTRNLKKSKGGKKDTPEVDTDPMQEQIANATGDGIKEGADEGAKELAKRARQALKDLKKEVQEEIASRIKDAMNDVVDNIKEALKNQKAAALGIYDAQIKKIEDVGKAEERLTKEQEYQNKLREAEDQRALNRLNSRRSYAMAIYSGQIDEARSIADESARQEAEDNKKIEDINAGRAEEVAEQNRKDMIDSIKEAKEAASKYFDDMIESFTTAAKKITEFPPTTAEEFNTMLNQLIDGGNGFIGARAIANNMGTVFSDSFGGALGQLGVNASGPLTSSLEAIGKVLTDNNPFGPTGIWNTTIDKTIDALTRKYQGLTNTLTTIIDTKSASFQKLLDVYTKYQNLVNPAEGTGGSGGGGGGGKNTNDGFGKGFNKDGVKIGNKVAIAAANADLGKIKAYSDKYLETKYGSTNEGKKLIAAIKGTVGSIASSSVLLGGHDAGMHDYMPIVLASKYKDQIKTNSELVYAYIVNNRSQFIKGAGAQGRTDESGRSGFFKGGMLPYGKGGATQGPVQQGIPALLHGGEYVVRNSAVKRYGWGMMDQINRGTYKPKPFANGGMVSRSNAGDDGIDYGTSRKGDKYYNKYLDFYDSLKYSGVEKDKAKKEFEWQVRNGGFNLRMMREIWTRESGRNWKNKGTRGRGGFGFNPLAEVQPWLAYGGMDSFGVPTADLATPYQQMVIFNRMLSLGYSNGKIRKEPLKATTALKSYMATGATPMDDNKFGNLAFKKGMIEYWKSKPKGISRIVSPTEGVLYVRTGSSGERPLVPKKEVFGMSSKGKKFSYEDSRDKYYTPAGFFKGGLVKGYETGGPVNNNGLPLPVPTPSTPGVGKPPPPYKTWAEYFAQVGQTKTPVPFDFVINWSKENEKDFNTYIKKGYIEEDSGLFISPFGDMQSEFATMYDYPGYRWGPENYIGGKRPSKYVLTPLSGAEAMWKGGKGAGKDWNVWNAKADRERLQGKGFFSPFKAIGYNLLSVATDLKHGFRRTLFLENFKTMMNSNAPATARYMAGFEDVMNLAPVAKGGFSKFGKPLYQQQVAKNEIRQLNRTYSMYYMDYVRKVSNARPTSLGNGPSLLAKAEFEAREAFWRDLIHNPDALMHGNLTGLKPSWRPISEQLQVERIQQLGDVGILTPEQVTKLLTGFPDITRRTAGQRMVIGPGGYLSQATLGATTYAQGGTKLAPSPQPGFKPTLVDLIKNYPERYRGNQDVYLDTANSGAFTGKYNKPKVLPTYLKNMAEKMFIQKRIFAKAIDVNTPLSSLIDEIPVTLRQNPAGWSRQKAKSLLGRESLFDFEDILKKKGTRSDGGYNAIGAEQAKARRVISTIMEYYSENPNATLLDLLNSTERSIPKKIKNIYQHFEGPDSPEFIETLSNPTGLSDWMRKDIISSLRVPLKFTTKKAAETTKLNFVAPNNNPLLGEAKRLLTSFGRNKVKGATFRFEDLLATDFVSEDAYKQAMRLIDESKIVRYGNKENAYIFDPLKPYAAKPSFIRGTALKISTKKNFLKGLKEAIPVDFQGKKILWGKMRLPRVNRNINSRNIFDYPGGRIVNEDARVFQYMLNDFESPLKTIKPHDLTPDDLGNFGEFTQWHIDKIEKEIKRLLNRKNLSALGGTQEQQILARDAAIKSARERIQQLRVAEDGMLYLDSIKKPKEIIRIFDDIFEHVGKNGWNPRPFGWEDNSGTFQTVVKPNTLFEDTLRKLNMLKDLPYLTTSEAYMQFGEMFKYGSVEHVGGVFTSSPFQHTAHMLFDPSILPEPNILRPAEMIMDNLRSVEKVRNFVHDAQKAAYDAQVLKIKQQMAIAKETAKNAGKRKGLLQYMGPNVPTGSGQTTSRAFGGIVPGFGSQGVPAMLHGGEYVVNSSAVKNIGIAALQAMNNMRFNTPKAPTYAGPVQGQTTSTSTTHIYVENFIGEKQWFESMMKDYNITVAPQNQRAAGLNNATISTYSGINRGL
jgi:TP901 family phage tail tape measure protein